jgi:hypothetical protein
MAGFSGPCLNRNSAPVLINTFWAFGYDLADVFAGDQTTTLGDYQLVRIVLPA